MESCFNSDTTSQFLLTLNENIDNFCDYKSVSKGNYFSLLLDIKGGSNFTNRFNPLSSKKLSLEDTIKIIIHIKDYAYPFLSLLSSKIGYTLIKDTSDIDCISTTDIKDELINMQIKQGTLFEMVQKFTKDNIIDPKEYTLIMGQIQLLQQNLSSLSNQINTSYQSDLR